MSDGVDPKNPWNRLGKANRRIAELEARLESEEAHYTRLVEQLAEERGKVERQKRALVHIAYFFGLDDSPYTAMKMRECAAAALQEGE